MRAHGTRGARAAGVRARPAIVLFALVALPAEALEVWVNQVGFDTAGPKRFRVVAPIDYGQVPAAFDVIDASGAVVMSGQAPYSGAAWGRHFWVGDASAMTGRGPLRIRARLGADTADSYPFPVGDGAQLRAAARAMVEFFFVQRCGYAVPGWHAACHTDDGQTPAGVRGDFTGGWHDSGEYQKYPGGFHPWATQALLDAYERRPDVFESLDVLVANGVPDILEEAIWGAAFEARMTDPNGHVWEQVTKVRSGSSWVIPEADTDRLPNTSDDRRVDESADPNQNGTLIAGNLARLHRILTARGGQPAPDPTWLPKAEAIWAYSLARGSGGLPYGTWEGNILGAIELHRATGNAQYATAADAAATALAQALISNPGMQDGDFVGAGRMPASLAIYLEHSPNGSAAVAARQAVVAVLDHWVTDMHSETVGLVRRDYYGQPVFFVGAPVAPDGWLRLGQNAGTGYTALAANLGAALTGDPRYARMAADQVDWVLGSNPQRWCMVQGLGTANPRGYHHRYAYIPGHLDGAVPGAVLNGYARAATALTVDAPSIDTNANTELVVGPYHDVTVANYITNEPWLPNNAGVLMALASAPFTGPRPALDGGTDAGSTDAGATDAGADAGAPVDAGARDAGLPDAGPPDGGSQPDAGADAGAPPEPDGGRDAGVNETVTPPARCGCSTSEPGLAAVLLALAWTTRRRPSTSRSARGPSSRAR